MRIPQRALPSIRVGVLAVFVSVCALVFGYLWVNSGGRIPGVSSDGYLVSLDMPNVSNLVYDSDVMIAGVKVGNVASLGADGGTAHVTVRLNSNAPLHAGATVQVRAKTLVQETYLEITDGSGAAIPSGGTLPSSAVVPYTDLNAVLAGLDPSTRQALGSVVNELGATTDGSRESIAQALSGLGDLGTQGSSVLDALAAQSSDLQQLTGSAAALLAALNTRQGEISAAVRSAYALTQATSGESHDIATAMNSLPGVLTNARSAGTSLAALSLRLSPVAQNLEAAAPDLNAAITQLPQTASDLRGLLPSLNSVLGSAPATLQLIPQTASDLTNMLPNLKVDVSDLNPMLAYLEPYGHDLAAWFTGFAGVLSTSDAASHLVQAMLVFNQQSYKGLPIDTNKVSILDESNPYPAPGSNTHPGPWSGTYPQIKQTGGP
jgi:phospholipid/cholesterol/gamma-HCH transport system substrate-binding protein